MTVPYAFGSATTSIPLSQLDDNFNTPITLGNTAIQLGNTVTTLNNMTLANVTVSSGNVTVTSASLSGNLTFTGTGNRITGDFTNATLGNRVAFQSSTTNGSTAILAIPNGTGSDSSFQALNSSSTSNVSRTTLSISATESSIRADKVGTGTYLPLTFYTNGSEAARIDTSGNVGIGTTAPAYNLDVSSVGDTTIRVQAVSSGAGADDDANLILDAANTGEATIYFRRANSAVDESSIYREGASSDLRFATNGSFKAIIDSSGKVGIGTDSPTVALNVVGAVLATGNVTGGYNNPSAGTTAMAFGSYNVVKVTPNATATYTTTVPAAGTQCTLIVLTSGTTSYTITFGTGFKTTGTLATGTTSARYFMLSFVSDGTNVLETARTVAIA